MWIVFDDRAKHAAQEDTSCQSSAGYLRQQLFILGSHNPFKPLQDVRKFVTLAPGRLLFRGEIAILRVPADGPGNSCLDRCVMQSEVPLRAGSVVGMPIKQSSRHLPADGRLTAGGPGSPFAADPRGP